jgi:hypothetical protein
MGQTIICEYLAAWELTGIAPDPTAFGFDGLYSILVECQDTMLKLGTAANDGKRYIAEMQTALKNATDTIEDCARRIVAKDEHIADLQAQIATLKLDNATPSLLALSEQNIFSYSTPPSNAA